MFNRPGEYSQLARCLQAGEGGNPPCLGHSRDMFRLTSFSSLLDLLSFITVIIRRPSPVPSILLHTDSRCRSCDGGGGYSAD